MAIPIETGGDEGPGPMRQAFEKPAAYTSPVRLLHLMSPSLPTGGFAYSQGLEWAVEAKWVHDDATLSRWLSDLMRNALSHADIPVLKRLYHAFLTNDADAAAYWTHLFLSMRETSELFQEELTRGRALSAVIKELGLPEADRWHHLIRKSQLAGYAFASVCWGISPLDLAHGYLWSWLENLVLAGIKLIPLGQTQGQKILFSLTGVLEEAVATGLALSDDEIGSSMQALAIGSCLHETQYTRLFRS